MAFLRSAIGVCGKLYWHAMRSVPVGIRPGFLARNQGRRIGQALGSDQMLESRKPMIIVMRTVVGFPATRGGIEFVGKRGCPFLPCEMPCSESFTAVRTPEPAKARQTQARPYLAAAAAALGGARFPLWN
jgi:hypothetical protein